MHPEPLDMSNSYTSVMRNRIWWNPPVSGVWFVHIGDGMYGQCTAAIASQ